MKIGNTSQQSNCMWGTYKKNRGRRRKKVKFRGGFKSIVHWFGEGNYDPFVDVTDLDFCPFPTVFKVRNKHDGIAMEETGKKIAGKYFTEIMVKKIVVASNGYRRKEKNLSWSQNLVKKIQKLPVPLLHHTSTLLSPSSVILKWFDFHSIMITEIIHPTTCPPIPFTLNLVWPAIASCFCGDIFYLRNYNKRHWLRWK